MEKRQKAKDADVESLWHFATTLYAQEAVARACIAAQDAAGFDVNLLLHAAWLAHRGVSLTDADLEQVDALCGPWQRDVVAPLRGLRRRWKREARGEVSYTAIKAVELEAERQQLAMLAGLPLGATGSGTAEAQGRVVADAPDALLRANLAALCRRQGRAADALRDFAEAVARLPASVGGQEAP